MASKLSENDPELEVSVSMYKKLNTLVEKFSAAYADKYGQSLSNLFRKPIIACRYILFYVTPFVIGTLFTEIIEVTPFNINILTLDAREVFVTRYWILIPLIFLYMIGFLWSKKIEYKEKRLRSLRDTINWFYQDMEFDKNDYKDADIRITLWASVKRNQKIEKYKMMQIIDYIPVVSNSSKTPKTKYRKNKPSGRIFSFTKEENNTIKQIGLVGKCVIEFFKEEGRNPPKVYKEVIPEDVNFQSYMVENWNFTKAQAERLTQDRRAYICGPISDRAAQSLYGIIYMDTTDPRILTEKLLEKIEKVYLSRLAKRFVA